MKQLLTFLRTKYQIIGASLLGVLAGAAITGFAVVYAAIPDGNGTIHGCRNSTTTLLRVIDSASQSCDGNETGVNWDQNGVKGYARFTWNSSTEQFALDTARSKNVSNLYTVTVGTEDPMRYACFTTTVTPKTISTTAPYSDGSPYTTFKDGGGWTESQIGNVCDNNGTGANIGIAYFIGGGPTFVTIF